MDPDTTNRLIGYYPTLRLRTFREKNESFWSPQPVNYISEFQISTKVIFLVLEEVSSHLSVFTIH